MRSSLVGIGFLGAALLGCDHATKAPPDPLAEASHAAVSNSEPVTSRLDHLRSLRWNNRVVLVFAPDEEHPELLRQRALIARDSAGYKIRDLVVIEVVGEPEEGLRAEYGVPTAHFAALLIGKDGGVKMGEDAALASEKLFATIDVMPMRRQEMRDRR